MVTQSLPTHYIIIVQNNVIIELSLTYNTSIMSINGIQIGDNPGDELERFEDIKVFWGFFFRL